MVKTADIKSVRKTLLTDTTLTQCAIYFKNYLHMPLVKGGLGNDYMNWLYVWRNNINMGLTTWAEVSDIENTRSDCHAWGSSPNIEFFRTVLAIDRDAPGFSKIKIEPRLGILTNVKGEIPHPHGKIVASYLIENRKWTIKIILPKKPPAAFLKSKHYLIKAGDNSFIL
ncbi:MAG: alpha-L-rhamnosidase C-terminal domain-containing protein [Ferruginibacter sp.]